MSWANGSGDLGTYGLDDRAAAPHSHNHQPPHHLMPQGLYGAPPSDLQTNVHLNTFLSDDDDFDAALSNFDMDVAIAASLPSGAASAPAPAPKPAQSGCTVMSETHVRGCLNTCNLRERVWACVTFGTVRYT